MTTSVNETLKEYLSRPYPVRLNHSKEDQCWFVRYPDLPGCLADGQTQAEALENGEEAKALWIEGALEAGQPIPEPSVEHTEFSGRILFRTSKDNHRWLSEQADFQKISMNQVLSNLVSRARGGTEAILAVNELLKGSLQPALGNLQTAQWKPSAKLVFPSGPISLGGVTKFEIPAAAMMTLEQSNVLSPTGIAKMRLP